MEPANPLLPALRPDTPALLRRTGSLLGAVQGIQQEASAEYWLGLFINSPAGSDGRLVYAAKCEALLRHEVVSICKLLEQKRSEDKYCRLREYKYGGGAYPEFKEHIWREDNESFFDKLVNCFRFLTELSESATSKANTWLEGAKIFDGLPFRIPQRASFCYCKSFAHERRLTTLIAECRQCDYHSFWSNWPESWSRERIMSLDAAIECYPTYHETYWRRGEQRMASNDYQGAADDFEAYFRLGGPEIRWRFEWQARAYFKLGNPNGLALAWSNVTRLGGTLEIRDGELIDPNENDLPF